MRELTIPTVGEKIESIQVVKVLVQAGAGVRKDQPLLELETGKAVVEVPAPEAGTVVQVLVTPGQDVKVGQAYATFEPVGDTAATAAPASDAGRPAPDVVRPSVAAPSASSAAPTRIVETHLPSAPRLPPPPSSPEHHVPAAPSVRRFAREIGVEVDTVRGTGPHGRVSREDVMAHARELNTRRGGPLGVSLPPLPDFATWGEVETQKMSGIRQETASHLALCWSVIPHVTIHDHADITGIEELRRKYADRAEKAGGKLTMAVLVTRIVASALKRFPKFNASIDMERREVILKKYCHVGIAMASSATWTRRTWGSSPPRSRSSPSARARGSSSWRSCAAAASPSPTSAASAAASSRRSSTTPKWRSWAWAAPPRRRA
jgi:pyruvate dehydrogenase E2 component (dihydrolipoamide acetyltransferase)